MEWNGRNEFPKQEVNLIENFRRDEEKNQRSFKTLVWFFRAYRTLKAQSLRKQRNLISLVSTMANQQISPSRPWILEAIPLVVVILIAAHVFALVISKVEIPFRLISAFSLTLSRSLIFSFPLGVTVSGLLDIQTCH